MSQFNNCTNCFMPLNGDGCCPNCGHNRSSERQYAGVLPAFTLLKDRYLLGRVLGKGGFGVTYIAKDIHSNQICAVKEYMPAEYSTRSTDTANIVPFAEEKARQVFSHGREKFVQEAKTLIKLISDPIVVDIWDYFNQNNTAYLVMEYLDGQDLRKMARANGGKIDPDFAKSVFVTIASSLMEIHKLNILHRDLSPENIIVTTNGRVKLIDFGAARNYVSNQRKGMSILLKPGYAPPEQYSAKGAQGPWSDVYALCATFYTLVSGKPLVDALFRYRGEQQPSLISLGCPVSKKTSDVIEKGMELDYKKRYKNFKELLDDIDIAVSSEKGGGSKKFIGGSVTSGDRAGHGQAGRASSVLVDNNTGAHNGAASQYCGTEVQSVKPLQAYPFVAAVVGGGIRNKIPIGTNDIFKIGRSIQSCRFVISGDTNISRIHCYIRVDGNKVFLTDASVNGTFFENGTRLIKNREYEIRPGTKFYLATPNHMLIILM